MAYITIADIESFMRTTFNETENPTTSQIQTYIDNSEANVNEFAGTIFGETLSETEVLSFDIETAEIFLRHNPINSVVSVKRRSTQDDYDSPNFDIDIPYVIDENLIFLKEPVTGKNCIQIIYNYGMSNVPQSVKDLTTLLTVQTIINSSDVADGEFSEVRIGPLFAKRAMSATRLVNIKYDIIKAKRSVPRFRQVVR